MNEEEIRRKKLEEFRRRQEESEKLEQIKTALRVALQPDAYDRVMNVMLANPELFQGAVQYIVALYQKVGRKLTDEEVRRILIRLKGEEKKPEISFKRK
ncbi:MAG: DNA-binding protein [Candidatus Anstonellales archaeon]